MNNLVIYYSLTGRTHYEAKCIAERENAERYEVFERSERSMFNAALVGVGQARRRERANIEPIAVRMGDYDKVTILCPIWGGHPAPAFNSIVREIPEGTHVEIILTSDSGRARRTEKIRESHEEKGVIVDKLEVIKTIDLKKRDKLREKKLKQEEKKSNN